MLAQLDIKSAYRLVSVHPDDRPLLGIQWQGGTYVDGMLPFGLRSAPKIFMVVADALEWCIREAGVSEVDHYLDDFDTLGPAGSQMCRCNLDTVMSVCRQLGVAAGWNGRALLLRQTMDPMEFASDASGSWGCGAWSGSQWFQVEWPQDGSKHITFKELAATVMALATWGRAWRG